MLEERVEEHLKDFVDGVEGAEDSIRYTVNQMERLGHCDEAQRYAAIYNACVQTKMDGKKG